MVEDKDSVRFTERWQVQLLPVMRTSVILLAAFFFIASLFQYRQLYEDVRYQTPSAVAALVDFEKKLNPQELNRIAYVHWRTMVVLEQDVMRMRYQQINSSMLLRAWTRYTGFLVGMVLALTGAFFILGRLKEDMSQLSGESGGLKVAVISSSPGVILVVLGTVLMAITLVVKFDFEMADRPVYVVPLRIDSQVGAAEKLPPPEELPGDESAAPLTGPDDAPRPPSKTTSVSPDGTNQ